MCPVRLNDRFRDCFNCANRCRRTCNVRLLNGAAISISTAKALVVTKSAVPSMLQVRARQQFMRSLGLDGRSMVTRSSAL